MPTNSAAQTLWCHGSSVQSPDLTKSSESQIAWPQKPMDCNYYSSMVRSEAVWHCSPPPQLDVSLNLFSDAVSENKIGLSGYGSPLPSRPNNSQSEKGPSNPDSSAGCRLFGFNISSNLTANVSSLDRETPQSSVAAPIPSDRCQNQEASEQKVASEAPRKDSLCRQGSTLSSRSRTKVVNYYFIIYLK